MSAKCQTQLKFDLAPATAEQPELITERFAFRGKSYVATIAPRHGCRLKVGPDRHRPQPRETRAAFLAFRDEHGARVDALYYTLFPAARPPLSVPAHELPF